VFCKGLNLYCLSGDRWPHVVPRFK
jgi:hypothetical protein